MKLYKGYTRAQLIDILADYAVFTATINNDHGGAPQNTNKGDYVGLYSTYPMNSRKYPAFSLSVRFLYKGIIIKHNKTEPTYTKTSLFLCEKRRFFMARTEKGVVATI